jgi:hypothetical protein
MEADMRIGLAVRTGCTLRAAWAGLLTLVAAVAASAQPAVPAVAPPLVPPVVDAAKEVKGFALVEALRKGGFVMYMRHALQNAPVTGPCMGDSLQPKGEADARAVGAAMRALKIPVGRLLTSEPCRNIDTAKAIELGAYEISTDLNPVAADGSSLGPARQRLLAAMPRPGSNTLLISHVHGSQIKSEWLHLETTEIIVFQPDGAGGTVPVARIRPEHWPALLQLAGVKL